MNFKEGDTVWFYRTDRQRVTGDYHAIDLRSTYLDYSTIVKMHENGHMLLAGWGDDEFWSFHLYRNKNDALRSLELRCYELIKREQTLRPLTDSTCDHLWSVDLNGRHEPYCIKCMEVRK